MSFESNVTVSWTIQRSRTKRPAPDQSYNNKLQVIHHDQTTKPKTDYGTNDQNCCFEVLLLHSQTTLLVNLVLKAKNKLTQLFCDGNKAYYALPSPLTWKRRRIISVTNTKSENAIFLSNHSENSVKSLHLFFE